MEVDFERAAETHRRELLAHCYRMLGSLPEAEDTVQETLLKAWRGLPEFAGRSSLRTWLYKIATNLCLDVLEKRQRRTAIREKFAPAVPAAPLLPALSPNELNDPCPRSWWEATPDATIGAKESVALAFIAALDRLSPVQRAVLLLRDVLDFTAQETAELLEKSTGAVESALERARAPAENRQRAPSEENTALLRRYLAAWEGKDATALTALLREDASLSMPPLPAWFSGRDAVVAFLSQLWPQIGEVRGRVIDIAGGVGLATWTKPPDAKVFEAASLSALTIEGGAITAIDSFLRPDLFRTFDLPATI